MRKIHSDALPKFSTIYIITEKVNLFSYICTAWLRLQQLCVMI